MKFSMSSLKIKRDTCILSGSKKKKKDDNQKQKPVDEAEPIMSAQASSCPIADALTDSFASLKVDDIRTENENARSGKAGNDLQKTKVPKKGKRRKGGNDKAAEAKTGAEGHVEKPGFAEALDNGTHESKAEVRNSTNNGNKDNPSVHENDAEVLDDSNNDSFVPLSMRVKKKLQKKNAVDKFDMLVSTLDKNNIPEIENVSDGCASNKAELELVSRAKVVNHPSFNDSCAFSFDLDSIDTTGQLDNVSEGENKVFDDSVVQNKTNFENIKSDRHISCTPRTSGNECNSDTPLSLQKQFLNDRFNTKVSSPLVEDFSSPVTYIKQNSDHNDKSQSFIEILDTPDIRKPAILISDDTDRMNIVASIPFEENIDKMEISEMKDSPFRDLGLDSKISVEDKRLDIVNKLVTTPLYSVNRCAQNTLLTVASPLHLLCKSKLNISEMSLLDKPDFNVQTSLLNSLCKTLNITSSPASFSYDQNLIAENDTDASFDDTASQAMNSESDNSQTGLENIHDSHKKVYNDSQTRNEEVVLTANFAQRMANETNLTVEQVECIFVNEETKTTIAKTLDQNMPIAANCNKESAIFNEVSKDGMGLESSGNNSSENSNIALEKENNDKDAMLNDNFRNAVPSDFEANLECIYGTKADGRPVLEDITNRKNSQNENGGRLEEISASQKQKKGKTKGSRKGKKKVVKKVSGVMDLSHDSDDSFILSQMISSQKQMISSQKQMISSQKQTFIPDKTQQTPASALQIIHENEDPPSMICEETSPIQEADKENIATISQSAKEIESGRAVGEAKRMSNEDEKEYTAELMTTICSKVVPSNTKYNKTYSIEKVDTMKCGPPLNVPSNENVTSDELNNNGVIERVILKSIDDAPETIDKMHKKTESPALSDANIPTKVKPLQAKSHATLDTTVAASSPVSLADRLKKRLKNSSTRQVLTDFTK